MRLEISLLFSLNSKLSLLSVSKSESASESFKSSGAKAKSNKKPKRKMSYWQAKLYGHDSLPLSIHFPRPPRVRTLTAFPKPQRLVVLAMAVKRSPKRLKYSTPRFTKEGGLLYVEADSSGADSWKLEPIVDLLKQGAVGVIPTDTLYAIVCDLKNPLAIERLRRIKNIEASKPLSILCHSFRDIDTYTTGFPRGDSQGHANIFRAVKHCLPGPVSLFSGSHDYCWEKPEYTFILTASKELPKQCIRNRTAAAKYAVRKNVGVRMPDDAICQAILEKTDAPLISTSVKCPKENEWLIDPVVIADVYGPEGLDFVVDGGVRVADPSTVVDMTVMPPKIIRQGKGPKLHWLVAEDDNESDAAHEANLVTASAT